MMESNFQRRASGNNRNLGVLGAPRGSLSPKGTIKKKKQDRKTKERQDQAMCNLNIQIGRLEDRDTQQQAFATLIESLPGLDSSLVKEVYSLIEKNKRPSRSSTRRMLVLLIAALCRCHPVQTAKLLSRILSYTCLRLRDRHAKTTDACVILMSAISLYVLPCPSVSLPGYQTSRGDGSTQLFEAVAIMFAKEANAIGDAATRCICGLLNPVDFDGVSVPGPSTLLAHATRIHPFFKALLAETVAKMDGSTMFASFSPSFLLLQSVCRLARDANEKASFTQFGDDFAPFIDSIYEAIEDAFQCGPRDDWMLRKRGLELLTMLLDIFALQDSPWCTSVPVSRGYFQAHLERVRALVLAGRHDSVSLVREAAIPAALAFEHLEKLCPQTIRGPDLKTSGNYDFVLPSPPGYSSIGKRWAQPAAIHDRDICIPNVSDHLPSESLEEENSTNFGDLTTGDEALPSHDASNESDYLTNQVNVIRSRSNRLVDKVTVEAKATSVPPPAEISQDDERFMDLLMDQAENGDQADHPQLDDEPSVGVLHKEPSKARVAPLPSSTGARVVFQTKVRPPTATAVQSVATLKQFAAKQKAHVRSRRSQYQDIPNISLPKWQMLETNNDLQKKQDINERDSTSNEKEDDFNLKLTRAEAALEAAQCGEFELAFRLCIVEDDLELLRRTMAIVKTPCIATLSGAVHNALFTAFLVLLDGDGGEDDVWLVLQSLLQWAGDIGRGRRQFDELDPRVAQALHTKLSEMAIESTKSALAAAHVLFLLGI